MATIDSVIKQELTYLNRDALLDLASVIINNRKNKIDGVIVETGCALGGSAIIIASSKSKSQKFFIFDVFGIIPQPSAKDEQDVHERYETIISGNSKGIGKSKYYGYEEDLYGKVVNNFLSYGLDLEQNHIYLVTGLYEKSLFIDHPVSLAHIDCDWYDSVYTCLSRIEPHLVSGGTLVIDDYYVWTGCRRAVDEYFENIKAGYDFYHKSRLHIVKK
ncbi:asparagine synthase [Nodosilinea sp. LEGE 06152]|nr:TylF/MycF/NovP-related O-methyltransferase [Nodosilinea sp. LEGE 06152]MBE9158418.1 asparagine synthase [Nodosilinea sp. LEGE 06152]